MIRGVAVSYGAVTIVNAIPTGKGAAASVDLCTTASVNLKDDAEIKTTFEGERPPDSKAVESAVRTVLGRYSTDGSVGASVRVKSAIPVGCGLKSSSAACNAVVMATARALNVSLDDETVLRLSVDSALSAGVTVTGALDDASASYFGGAVVTDNGSHKILRKERLPADLVALVLIPEASQQNPQILVQKLGQASSAVERAFSDALNGKYWSAMTTNGLACAAALGHDTSVAREAIDAGALGAGLTGKGPAVAAIVASQRADDIFSLWSKRNGRLLRCRVNNEKARSWSEA